MPERGTILFILFWLPVENERFSRIWVGDGAGDFEQTVVGAGAIDALADSGGSLTGLRLQQLFLRETGHFYVQIDAV
jgi:hypothetical protein